MRVRTFLCLPVLLLAALVSSPAGARPCCSDCPSWPDLDPSDPCAWVCDFSCFAVSAPRTSPVSRADHTLEAFEKAAGAATGGRPYGNGLVGAELASARGQASCPPTPTKGPNRLALQLRLVPGEGIRPHPSFLPANPTRPPMGLETAGGTSCARRTSPRTRSGSPSSSPWPPRAFQRSPSARGRAIPSSSARRSAG